MDDQGGKEELSGADMAADNTKKNRDSQLTSGAVRTPSTALPDALILSSVLVAGACACAGANAAHARVSPAASAVSVALQKDAMSLSPCVLSLAG